LAVLLAWVAGTVDAIGYLTLSRLFTAHMSGNSAAMSAEFGAGQRAQALHRLLPIPLFVAGVAVGAALIEVALRRSFRSPFAFALSLQAILLLIFLVWGGARMHGDTVQAHSFGEFVALVALPSLAMGVQNATLRKVGSENVRTTYVSGMLTNFAENGVAWLFWMGDHIRGKRAERKWRVLRVAFRQPALWRMALFGGIWAAFAVGALMGGWGASRWETGALLLPLAGLALVIGIDLAHPIYTRSRQVKSPTTPEHAT
jgi:uncharacterized membrane protein YoaK (UPF0700 family)